MVFDYLVENEWYLPESKPFCGYYRRPAHPPHVAVNALIVATHRALIQSLAISSGPINRNTLDDIHRQRCSEEPNNWSLSPALSAPMRKERSAAPAKKKPATASTSNDLKSRIKRAIKDSGEAICISFNVGAHCPCPQTSSGCTFKKTGQSVELAHTCAFLLPNGTRCKSGHPWKGNHP